MMTSTGSPPGASGDGVDSLADHLAYLEEQVLPRAARAREISAQETERMFAWASLCDRLAGAAGVACATGTSRLLRTLLNNLLLPKAAIDRARQLREAELGYPDMDFRAAEAQRRQLRRTLVIAARLLRQ